MGAAVMGAATAVKERHIVERFRDAGATSPSTACSISDVSVSNGIAYRRLRWHEVIREAAPSLFYLDEGVWVAARRTRRRFANIATSLILVVGIGTAVGFITLT